MKRREGKLSELQLLSRHQLALRTTKSCNIKPSTDSEAPRDIFLSLVGHAFVRQHLFNGNVPSQDGFLDRAYGLASNTSKKHCPPFCICVCNLKRKSCGDLQRPSTSPKFTLRILLQDKIKPYLTQTHDYLLA